MKTILLTITFIGVPLVFGEGLGLPTLSQLEQQQGVIRSFPDNDLPEDWTTRPPKVGEIRLYAEILLKEAKDSIVAEQASVPNGANGKESVTYTKIIQWLQAVDAQLLTKTQIKLIELNSLNAEILKFSRSEGDLDTSVINLAGRVRSTNSALIYNAFDFINNNQKPNIAQHDNLLSGFYCSGFVDPTEWEDPRIPIDRAGVFIINPDNAVTKLKTKSIEEIETFLGGSVDISFFERYEANGDGANVLKLKYAANKAVIQSKFAEILAHLAQLENKQ
jgi:hypothetical protein